MNNLTAKTLIAGILLGQIWFLSSVFAEGSFDTDVHPFLKTYCLECHTTEESKGGMDLEVIQRAEDFMEHPTALTHVIEVLDFQDMPPQKAKQPSEEEVERVMAWLNMELNRQRNAAPNDPGIVVAPRLNSSEYGNAIRFLFNTDRFDASGFITAEGGAGEGFSNVGEAQSMVTSQFESYLSAAGRVLSHARITPQSGMSWASAPQGVTATSEDLSKKLLQTWTDWYSVEYSEQVDAHLKHLRRSTGMTWGNYAQRSWELQHARALRLPWRTIEDAAQGAEPKLFPVTLDVYHTIFTGEGSYNDRRVLNAKFLRPLQERYNRLDPRELSSPDARKAAFQELQTFYDKYTEDGRWRRGIGKIEDIEGSDLAFRDIVQPWEGGVAVLPVDLGRVTTGEVVITLSDAGDGNEEDYVLLTDGKFKMSDGREQPWEKVLPRGLTTHTGKTLAWGSDMAPGGASIGPGQMGVQAPVMLKFKVPPGAERFIFTVKFHPNFKNSSVIPGVDDAPPELVDGRMLERRVLGAGQSQRARAFEGEFRKVNTIADDFGRFGRAEDRAVFADLNWLNAEKARKLGIPWPQDETLGRRSIMRIRPDTIYRMASPERRELIDAVGAQLEELSGDTSPAQELAAAKSLLRITAARAWRRIPTAAEMEGLIQLYQIDRDEGLTYDFALKTALKAILVSPEFLYRFQDSQQSTEPYRISGRGLADRLAFFIWAGPPDDELLRLAFSGDLQNPHVLKLQAKRMLDDPRAGALASEFGGQWLHFAGFDKFSGPDSNKFPEFTDEIKQAMYDESRLFIEDLLKNNRPLNNLIEADYTFANEALAKFYGLRGVEGDEMRIVSTEGSPRGGLLAMGSILTTHSAPLRTSQVKRGVWVYEQLLGFKLPPPPPVPLLSDEETNEDGLTVGQQLALHRAKPECASCHDKFDALGFAMENFDPIGRWRTHDGAGNPVENKERLGTGQMIEGLDGLQKYLYSRFDEVIMTYCSKLAGYALGRGLLITDKPLLDEMAAAVKASGNRPQPAIGVLLSSRQFLYRRDEVPETASLD